MTQWKDRIIRCIQQNARHRAARLAGSYLRARPEEREAIMAGIEFERWLADSCQLCLQGS